MKDTVDRARSSPASRPSASIPEDNVSAAKISASPESRRDGSVSSREAHEPVNLYVKNVGPDTKDEDLRAVFERFGTVVSCSVVRDPFTKLCRGFAFVKLATAAAADAAMSAEGGMDVNGRRLNVERARRNGPHDKTPGQYLGVDRNVQERYAGYKRAFEGRRAETSGFDARDQRGFGDRVRGRERERDWDVDFLRDRRSDRFSDRDKDADGDYKGGFDRFRDRLRDRDVDLDRDVDKDRDRILSRDRGAGSDLGRERDRLFSHDIDRERYAPRRRLSPEVLGREFYSRDRLSQDPRDIRFDRDSREARRYRDSRDESPRDGLFERRYRASDDPGIRETSRGNERGLLLESREENNFSRSRK